jgi:hypothetical protein
MAFPAAVIKVVIVQNYKSCPKSHMADRGRISILTKLPGESFPSSAGSDQLFYTREKAFVY